MEVIKGPGLFSAMDLDVRNGASTSIRNQANGRWLALTPEEQVRQGLIAWMVQKAAYPKTIISTERRIRLGRMVKRFDVVVLDREGLPFLLAECKAPTVPLSPAVAEQAARYNSVLQAPYLLITNGLEAVCFQMTVQGYQALENWLPPYPA